MKKAYKIGTVLAVVSLLLSGNAASAATKTTCFNTKTAAKKIVTTAKCPKGFSLKKPVLVKTEQGVTVSLAWVKALDTAMAMNGTYMTAAFMHISNISDRDVTLVGGTATWSPRVEVHEVVRGMMQMKPGGLTIKAGYTESLQAGGNHVMFVGMPKKVLAGDEVTFVLKFADGGQLTVKAPVKASNAGSETYKPSR